MTISVNNADFAALLERVHKLGKTVVAPHAGAVDRDARFPAESFQALKELQLLSCYVPAEYGGMGLSFTQVTRICEALGNYCGSTAMVFAMHQIQVGCIVHHCMKSAYFQQFVRDLVKNQYLLASATTEVGIGGDVRRSICALQVEDDRFTLEKQAPVISYAEAADFILVTCRRNPTAAAADQLHVLVPKADCELTPLSTWDTLGFRGTCSAGFVLKAHGKTEQVLTAPYGDIHAQTMHPFSHTVWSALWYGMAHDAVEKARTSVRAEARKTPGTIPPTALRLSEVDGALFTLRASVYHVASEYEAMLDSGDPDIFQANYPFALKVNNLKITASQAIIDIIGKAMSICGITAYRNDHPLSLGRALRDAYGASLMVHNDRILGQSSTMQIMRRE